MLLHESLYSFTKRFASSMVGRIDSTWNVRPLEIHRGFPGCNDWWAGVLNVDPNPPVQLNSDVTRWGQQSHFT